MKHPITHCAFAVALVFGVAACGTDRAGTTDTTDTTAITVATPDSVIASIAGEATATAVANATVFPLTFDNCGQPVTLKQSPKKLLITEAASVATLDAVGALDRVIARTGEYPTEYFSEAQNAKIAKIPALTSTQSSGVTPFGGPRVM
jgi:ABC-type enterochelin transport system substrate-binding protein